MTLSRVLIVRLGALGDVVHAIPVAAALRRAFPQARIDWLVSAKHREILDLVPVIDRRLVINDRAAARDGLPTLRAVGQLRAARYDVAIDLQGLIKSALLARLSGAVRVVGFAASYARERLARLFYAGVYDPGRGGLYDPYGDWASRSEVDTTGCVLIRPDGHVAWRSPTTTPTAPNNSPTPPTEH